MNLRSFKAVFFALIFLTSKIGLALNVHYCGGHIEKIALAWNAEGCEMSVEKAQDSHQGLKLTKNHCCKDQTIFIQNNEPQKTADYVLQLAFFGILSNKSLQFLPPLNFLSPGTKSSSYTKALFFTVDPILNTLLI